MNTKTLKRFEDKYIPVPESGCWLWEAGMSIHGYGQFSLLPITTKAHRAAWIIYRGPIPQSMCVLHKCDVRCCVNPDHLFLGTLLDNNIDRDRKGRRGNVHKNRTKYARGEKNGITKLTNEIVLEIYKAEGTEKQVAEQYDLHQTTVHRIKTGKRWAHITGANKQSSKLNETDND